MADTFRLLFNDVMQCDGTGINVGTECMCACKSRCPRNRMKIPVLFPRTDEQRNAKIMVVSMEVPYTYRRESAEAIIHSTRRETKPKILEHVRRTWGGEGTIATALQALTGKLVRDLLIEDQDKWKNYLKTVSILEKQAEDKTGNVPQRICRYLGVKSFSLLDGFVYWTMILKCIPASAKYKKEQTFTFCRMFLNREIRLMLRHKTKIHIIALGIFVYHSIISLFKEGLAVGYVDSNNMEEIIRRTPATGCKIPLNAQQQVVVFPFYHPGAPIVNPKIEKNIERFKLVQRVIQV